LAILVLNGQKRGTASISRAYEIVGDPLPKCGEYSVITDFEGNAKCIIQTTTIEIYPFKSVPSSFAKHEGEGDLSLKYWRKIHADCFSRELAQLGETFNEDMDVICEYFNVVYPVNK